MNKDECSFLALSVHRDEPASIDRLVNCFQDILYTYACALVRNKFDAQEVTQDTFIRAIDSLRAKYSEAQCRELLLRPWLFRITRNLAMNRRRSRRRHYEGDQEIGDDLADTNVLTDEQLICEDRRRTVHLAIDKLDASGREMIVLRFVEELSYKEIAQIAASTEASVRGRVFRSLQKLKSIMRKMEADDGL